jgi:hypothetical protein
MALMYHGETLRKDMVGNGLRARDPHTASDVRVAPANSALKSPRFRLSAITASGVGAELSFAPQALSKSVA